VVTTTTQLLADRLTAAFDLPRPALRIRNAPLSATTRPRAGDSGGRDAARPVDLVWHGFAVHLTGRGVDVLLEAVSRCRQPVRLTLQGRLSDVERHRIDAECARLRIADKVRFTPPAHPEAIPASLVGYDVGVIAEPGLDENQRLTSSNKLFECIHAGLAVIAPDLPGLAETISAEQVGVLYRAGDADDLAGTIDRIASDAEARSRLRRRSSEAAAEITWSRDFVPVWAEVEAALSRARHVEPVADLHEARL
jgi:glycosyltransferase involved in cell wall biosynthesis